MFNPFKPKIEVAIKKVGEHSDLPEPELREACDLEKINDYELQAIVQQITLDDRWCYVEALIVRERKRLYENILFAKGDDFLTIQGKIKQLNWLLQLSLKK